MSDQRVAIVGAGSLGTIMGAVLSHNGGNCDLVDTNQKHIDALNKNGATVTGAMALKNVPVHAITPQQMEGIYDIVILLTKQTANPKALPSLLNHLGENSVVCTLQNGIPEESVAAIVGRDRVVGGTVGWGGGWLEPGIAQLYTHPDHMRIEIGNLDGTIDDKMLRVESFLKQVGEVDLNENFIGARWSKLLMNSALSGMSAALSCTFGDVIDDDKAVACAAYIARELIEVADKKGVALEIIIPDQDFYDLRFTDQKGLDSAIAMLRDIYQVHRPQKASMLQDMEKGIPCEINYINGVVCSGGDEFNIDTPFNDTVAKIIKEFEAGKRPLPTMQDLDEFIIPSL